MKCLPVMEKIELGKIMTTCNYNSGENVTMIIRSDCEYSASHVIFIGCSEEVIFFDVRATEETAR